MSAEILTLAGTAMRRGPAIRPQSRLDSCPIAQATRDGLTPLNNCILALEAEMRRPLALVGSDRAEWAERIAEVAEKVGGKDE